MQTRVRRLTASLVAAAVAGAMPAAVGVLAPAAGTIERVRINPGTVYDGESTTVSGDNCPYPADDINHRVEGKVVSESNEVIADFTLDLTAMATNPTAGIDGNSWETQVQIPEGTPAGLYEVRAQCIVGPQLQAAGFGAPAQDVVINYEPAILEVLNQPVPEEPEPEAPAEEQPAAEEPAEARAVVAQPTYTG